MTSSVIIDGRLIGYRHGGITNYARQLARHIPAFAGNVQVRLASRNDTGPLSDWTIRAITPPHHRLERWTFGLEILLRSPHLLHSVDYIQPVVPGVRTIVTVHDLAFLTHPERVTPDSYQYYSQILETLPSADHVIAVSEWTHQQILGLTQIDPDRVTVVPNGYDHTIFGPVKDLDDFRLSRLHPGLNNDNRGERPLILMVGTIEPRKRHSIILDAFRDHYDAMSTHAGTQPLLVVAGQPGWLSEVEVEELRRLQRNGRAVWLRDVNDCELAALYRAAELLVMPSAEEGFGLPVLEAMASGTACLVANVGALPELLRDTGFYEESADSDQWADKIGRILGEHSLRDHRVKRAIERASPLTWKETSRKTLKVYRKVLDD